MRNIEKGGRGNRKAKGKSRQEKSCVPLRYHHKGGLGLARVGLSSMLELELMRPFDLALVSAGSNVGSPPFDNGTESATGWPAGLSTLWVDVIDILLCALRALLETCGTPTGIGICPTAACIGSRTGLGAMGL